jgi:flagellar motor switch protein FliN/FliY
MSEAVTYEQLDQSTEPPGMRQVSQNGTDLRRLSDVPMELSVEIGRTCMTVGETLQLRPGSIVTLARLAGEPVDLLVNGTPIARGEVVIVDEEFGLRVTEIVEGDLATANRDEREGGDSIIAGGESVDQINGDAAQAISSQADPAQADPAVQE